MQRQTLMATCVTLGLLSLCLGEWPNETSRAWAAEGHEKAGAPGGSYGLEVAIPDGVIGVPLT